MRLLAFSSLLLFSATAAFCQDKPVLTDKAPPSVEEALRSRVNKFYGLFSEGKFKEAYLMVADDSQDKYFEMAKDQYKGCEIIKINYTQNFTKATVVTGCKTEWRFHGSVAPITFPLTSTWEIIDGQWLWHYEKPTMVATPFSPTGFVPATPENSSPNAPLAVPDIATAGRDILSKIGIDKSAVRLLSNQRSIDVIHLRNDMPGEVSITVDQPQIPGLKIGLGKEKLTAHEQTTISFEYQPQSGSPVDVHRKILIHVIPTAQVFSVDLSLEAPTANPAPPTASQK